MLWWPHLPCLAASSVLLSHLWVLSPDIFGYCKFRNIIAPVYSIFLSLSSTSEAESPCHMLQSGPCIPSCPSAAAHSLLSCLELVARSFALMHPMAGKRKRSSCWYDLNLSVKALSRGALHLRRQKSTTQAAGLDRPSWALEHVNFAFDSKGNAPACRWSSLWKGQAA